MKVFHVNYGKGYGLGWEGYVTIWCLKPFGWLMLVQGEDIVEDENLHLAAKAANMEDVHVQECLKLMNDSSVKLALKKSTEDAIEYGVWIFSWLTSSSKSLKFRIPKRF